MPILPPWFRYRTNSADDVLLNPLTYNHHSFNEIAKRSNLPIRAWQDVVLYPEEEDLEAFMVCKEYRDNVTQNVLEGNGLYIHSRNSGTGKSTWAYKIAREFMEDASGFWELGTEAPVYFANVPMLLNQLKQSFNNDEQMRRFDKLMLTSHLVIFDDLGAENATDWAKEKLYQYIDFRYANGKACIFTSNKSVDELEFRIADRIKGMCKLVSFISHSKRT